MIVYFLQLYSRHVLPVADTFAYCLMKNHFHLLVRIKTSRVSETREVSITSREASQAFSNLLNAYAKAINKADGRTGSLFEERFGRIEVTSDAYFCHLISYIHFNPQKHGFVEDFRQWPWSSFDALRSPAATRLTRAQTLEWFGGIAEFERFHSVQVDEAQIRSLIEDDFA